MKRKIAVIGAALIVTLALAATTIVGAIGRGNALSLNGKRAEFSMDAKKVTVNGVVRVTGPFRLAVFGGTQAHPEIVRVVLPAVQRFAKAGRVAEFGGFAERSVWTLHGVRNERGVCEVRVEDNRALGGTSEHPDKLRIRFVAHETNHVYEWAGKVVHGDIHVYERVEQ